MSELIHDGSNWANTSSLHRLGRTARRLLEEQRESIASLLGARPSEILFTSGGTESDNLALKGLVRARKAEDPARRYVLVSSVEHHAILDPALALIAEGAEIRQIEADALGAITPDAVLREIQATGAENIAVLSVMWANNEVGTINDIDAISAIAKEFAIPFHSDAVQAAGHIPMNLETGAPTATSIAAHKFGGPVGIGALVLARDASVSALVHGGGHERGLRAGTANVVGAVGMASALKASVEALPVEGPAISDLRLRLWKGIESTIPGVVVNGVIDSPSADQSPSALPGILSVTFPGAEGDSLLMLLDAQGIYCSTGSACTAGVSAVSHVITAMGVAEDIARGTLRFSLGHTSTQADIDAVTSALPEVVSRARSAGLASGAKWDSMATPGTN